MRQIACLLLALCCLAFCPDLRAEEWTSPDPRAAIPVSVTFVDGTSTRLERTACPCNRYRDPCACPPRWEIGFELGAAFLPDPSGLVGVPSANPAQFSWGALDYPTAASSRFTLRRRLNQRDQVYLRFAWNGSVDDRSTGTGVVGFTPTPGGALGFTPSNTVTVDGDLESQTGEIGWWRTVHDCCPWRIDIGAALRYFHFHDEVRASGAMPFPAVGGIPSVRSLGHNLFFGLQPGGAIHYDVSRKLGLFAKAKVFAGGMLQDLEVSDQNVFSAGAHSANQDRFTFAWGTEVEVGARWRLNRCWSLTASYNLFFMDSVVRGFDALDFSRAATGAVQSQFKERTVLLHFLYVGAAFQF